MRQVLRHIPANLIARRGKGFKLSGEAEQIRTFVSKLNKLIQKYLTSPKPPKEKIYDKPLDRLTIEMILGRTKDEYKKAAFRELELARQTLLPLKVPVHYSQASAQLLQRRLLDYQMAFESIKTAEKWLGLMIGIEELLRKNYYELGRLGQELEIVLERNGDGVPSQVLEIANKAYKIWEEMNERACFNPYYGRVQASEFSGLKYVKKHAQEGRGETVLRMIKRAVAKLEAAAIGEKPTLDELEKQKKEVSDGPF